MPTERLSMRRIRDLLRLKYAQGMSDRASALSLGLSKGTVGNYLVQFSQAGLSWRLPPELDDDSLELLLFPRPTLALRLNRPVPDWAMMDRELRRPGVTRALLWEEYRAQSPDGFGRQVAGQESFVPEILFIQEKPGDRPKLQAVL